MEVEREHPRDLDHHRTGRAHGESDLPRHHVRRTRGRGHPGAQPGEAQEQLRSADLRAQRDDRKLHAGARWKFIWDFGYLWQITGWPENYNEAKSAMVAKYFCNDLVRGPLRMAEGDDRVFVQSAQRIAVSKSREGKDAARSADSICFFCDARPMVPRSSDC